VKNWELQRLKYKPLRPVNLRIGSVVLKFNMYQYFENMYRNKYSIRNFKRQYTA